MESSGKDDFWEKRSSAKNRMFLGILVLCSLLPFLIGCATNQGSSSARGHELSVRYGEVVDVERVDLPSDAVPAGAVLGGFAGLISASGRSGRSQLASAVGGAVLGGLVGKALEGDRQGFGYRIRFAGGSESRFITEKGYLEKGDCVGVERGSDQRGRMVNNIRRVPDSMCEPRPQKNPHPHHVQEARECVEAKQQLLDAKTNSEVKNAADKVKILCEF